MKNKKVLLVVIGILLIIAVSIGMSYAYYIATVSQVGQNVIRSDCFRLNFVDDGEIVLSNSFPIRDSAVNSLTPYHFTIKNVCNLPASYQVNLEVLDDSTLDIGYLNYKLDDGAITGLDNVSVESTTPTLNNATTAKIIATGNLLANEEKEYDLRVWMKESVTTADPVQNKTFKSKVVVISTLNKDIIKNITLHPNGGTIASDQFQGFVGYKFNNLPTPVKENEGFLGWYSDSELTQKVTNETLVTSEMTDLYAKYGIPYTILSGDLDTVGSEVKIGTEEFYVIGQEDSSHVKLLSKWNLNVGSNPKGTATNLQDSDVKGYVYGGTAYGNVVYSSKNYWHDSTNNKAKDEYGGYTLNTNRRYYDEQGNVVYPYVYDSNASIKTYVDNYVTYLNTQGVQVSGRLISYEELVALGCNAIAESSTYSCNSSSGGTAPSWVYQTSFWSGSVYGNERVWYVESGGFFYNDYYDSTGVFLGVRPVIILEK